MRRIAALATLLAVGLIVPPTTHAASKEYERLAIQIANLQGQLTELQKAADDSGRELRRLNQALADQNAFLKKAIDDGRLQDETVLASVKDLTERIGVLAERLQALQLGAGGSAPPAVGPTAIPGSPAAGAPSPGPGQAPSLAPPPRELYSQAYADYARGNYDLAIQEYREYLKNYPATEFSDNAQFWIGECHYSKQKFADAVAAWDDLFRDFPASDKLPDARLKKGMALEKLGRRREALVEYRYVVDRYPNSEAGRKAREKLSPQ